MDSKTGKPSALPDKEQFTWKRYYQQAALNAIVVIYGFAVAVL